MRIRDCNMSMFENMIAFEIGEHERVEIELFNGQTDGSYMDNYYELEPGDLYGENKDFIFIKSPCKIGYSLDLRINKNAIRQIRFRDYRAEAWKEDEERKRIEELTKE